MAAASATIAVIHNSRASESDNPLGVMNRDPYTHAFGFREDLASSAVVLLHKVDATLTSPHYYRHALAHRGHVTRSDHSSDDDLPARFALIEIDGGHAFDGIGGHRPCP